MGLNGKIAGGMIGVAMVLSLTGCINSGNQSVAKLNDDSCVQKLITNGKTTKEQVLASFGKPQEMDYSENGSVKFTYRHIRSTYKASSFVPIVGIFKSGTNDTHRQLVVVFDKNDVVEKHLFNISKSETVSGLLG